MHVIGVCLGILGAVTIVVIAVGKEAAGFANLGLRYGPTPNARALGRLQHVADLACQVGSTALRPLCDLFVDRRNLHACPSADEKRSGFSGSRRRRLVERRYWYGSQTRTSRSVRPPGHRALLAAGVEWCHCLRYACICPCRARAYGFSRLAAFSTHLAWSFMSGGACTFTTRSGMDLCCSRRVAIMRRYLLACLGHKRHHPPACS